MLNFKLTSQWWCKCTKGDAVEVHLLRHELEIRMDRSIKQPTAPADEDPQGLNVLVSLTVCCMIAQTTFSSLVH